MRFRRKYFFGENDINRDKQNPFGKCEYLKNAVLASSLHCRLGNNLIQPHLIYTSSSCYPSSNKKTQKGNYTFPKISVPGSS